MKSSPQRSGERRSRPSRPPRSRSWLARVRARLRLSRTGWAAVGFSLFALAGFALAVTLLVFSRQKGPAEGERFVLDIPAGLTPRELAHLLAEEGVVESEQLMAFYLGLSAPGEIAPGSHIVLGGSTPSEIADVLTRNPARKGAKLVIPEGFTRFAIADRLETLGISSRASFLAVTSDPLILEELEIPSPVGRGPVSAEGYLFPATYEIKLDTPAKDVAARLVRESHQRWKRFEADNRAAIDALAERFGWGRAEIVTLASIVEKEAAVDEERPIIASVFFNRLTSPDFHPKLLQSDPTSGYGCLEAPDEAPSCSGYTGKITGAINRDKRNRYSTYVNEGLPPGPIASPGDRSVSAVLSPATSNYFYFVASGGGRHTFSETLADHNKAIKR